MCIIKQGPAVVHSALASLIMYVVRQKTAAGEVLLESCVCESQQTRFTRYYCIDAFRLAMCRVTKRERVKRRTPQSHSH